MNEHIPVLGEILEFGREHPRLMIGVGVYLSVATFFGLFFYAAGTVGKRYDADSERLTAEEHKKARAAPNVLPFTRPTGEKVTKRHE